MTEPAAPIAAVQGAPSAVIQDLLWNFAMSVRPMARVVGVLEKRPNVRQAPILTSVTSKFQAEWSAFAAPLFVMLPPDERSDPALVGQREARRGHDRGGVDDGPQRNPGADARCGSRLRLGRDRPAGPRVRGCGRLSARAVPPVGRTRPDGDDRSGDVWRCGSGLRVLRARADGIGGRRRGDLHIVSIQNSLIVGGLLKNGDARQQARFLPDLTGGRMIGAFALTEPGAGSDAAAIRTRAAPANGGYTLNGAKQFITSGKIAGLAMVFAVTDPAAGKRGISAFLVPVETDEPLWRELAGLGFLGANIPEEFGGLGLTELESPAGPTSAPQSHAASRAGARNASIRRWPVRTSGRPGIRSESLRTR